MKVLVISHNVFDYTSSMGKTLTKYFESFEKGEVAQIYIHPENPQPMSFCSEYFRITDGEAARSIIKRNDIGEAFHFDETDEVEAPETTAEIGGIYQKGRSRTPIIYIARDTAWSLSNWKNKKLKDWILGFDPDVIFLASGDYKFIYNIALYVADLCNKPLVTACFDDFYIYNKNENRFLGKIRQSSFMKLVHKTMNRSSCIITVCEPMARAYRSMFSKPTHVLYTPAEQRNVSYNEAADKLAYFGSLGLGRDDQLVDIGRCFKAITGRNIDVYSSEIRPAVLQKLVPDSGIEFHGAVSAIEVKTIYQECMGVIHTESFDEKRMGRTRFSVSTKIAESLAYGPCLFAYGPKEIASIEYLINTKSAVVVTDPKELHKKLAEFVHDHNERKHVLERARSVALKNHNDQANGKKLRGWLNEAIDSFEGN